MKKSHQSVRSNAVLFGTSLLSFWTCFVILNLFQNLSFSQTTQVFEEWNTTDGTQNFFIKAAVKTDSYGDVYVAGATLNGAGDYDILVTKYDKGGNIIWADQYNGQGGVKI